MARPSKYSEDRAERILAALRRGNSRRVAAALGGVNEDTVSNWIRRYSGFSAAVTRAEAEAEAAHVEHIETAALEDWRASAWWLERRRHADWGKVDRVEIEVRRAAERVAAATGADPDWLIRRAAEIVAAAETGTS